MFKRLPTKEEDRLVSFVKATAIKVAKTEASEYFKNKALPHIPSHIKRVKTDVDQCYFLICMGIDSSVENYCVVNVPEHPPCTPEQFALATEVWPTNYCHISQEKVDFEAASLVMEAVVNKISCFDGCHLQNTNHQVAMNAGVGCSGICSIYSGDDCLYSASDHEHIFGHAILEAVGHVSRSKRGYLCTGYTAYLYTEPCLSCAMALVHSRIKNVFCYVRSSDSDSAPFSALKFNYNKNLNHRFAVYFYEHNEA